MIGYEEMHNNLRTFLRAELTHPITSGANWIYPGYPREDASFPRISINHIGTKREEIGLGDQGSRLISTFEIGIFCD